MKLCLLAVFLLPIAFPAFLSGDVDAQKTTKQTAASTDPDYSKLTFLQLREKRDDLDLQLQQARAQKATLDTIIYWLRKENSDKQELDTQLKSKHPDKRRVEELNNTIIDDRKAAATDLTVEAAVAAFAQKQPEIDGDLRLKDKIERAMSQVIDIEKPKQEFKTTISSIFAVLVAVVIADFLSFPGKTKK